MKIRLITALLFLISVYGIAEDRPDSTFHWLKNSTGEVVFLQLDSKEEVARFLQAYPTLNLTFALHSLVVMNYEHQEREVVQFKLSGEGNPAKIFVDTDWPGLLDFLHTQLPSLRKLTFRSLKEQDSWGREKIRNLSYSELWSLLSVVQHGQVRQLRWEGQLALEGKRAAIFHNYPAFWQQLEKLSFFGTGLQFSSALPDSVSFAALRELDLGATELKLSQLYLLAASAGRFPLLQSLFLNHNDLLGQFYSGYTKKKAAEKVVRLIGEVDPENPLAVPFSRFPALQNLSFIDQPPFAESYEPDKETVVLVPHSGNFYETVPKLAEGKGVDDQSEAFTLMGDWRKRPLKELAFYIPPAAYLFALKNRLVAQGSKNVTGRHMAIPAPYAARIDSLDYLPYVGMFRRARLFPLDRITATGSDGISVCPGILVLDHTDLARLLQSDPLPLQALTLFGPRISSIELDEILGNPAFESVKQVFCVHTSIPAAELRRYREQFALAGRKLQHIITTESSPGERHDLTFNYNWFYTPVLKK